MTAIQRRLVLTRQAINVWFEPDCRHSE